VRRSRVLNKNTRDRVGWPSLIQRDGGRAGGSPAARHADLGLTTEGASSKKNPKNVDTTWGGSCRRKRPGAGLTESCLEQGSGTATITTRPHYRIEAAEQGKRKMSYLPIGNTVSERKGGSGGDRATFERAARMKCSAMTWGRGRQKARTVRVNRPRWMLAQKTGRNRKSQGAGAVHRK